MDDFDPFAHLIPDANGETDPFAHLIPQRSPVQSLKETPAQPQQQGLWDRYLPQGLFGTAMQGLENVSAPVFNQIAKNFGGGALTDVLGKAAHDQSNSQMFRIGPDINELKMEPKPSIVQAGQPMLPGLKFANEDIDPVNRYLGGMARGFTTPGGATVAAAQLFPPVGIPLLATMIGSTIENYLAKGPENVQKVMHPQPGSDERIEGALNLVGDPLMAAGMMKGVLPEKAGVVTPETVARSVKPEVSKMPAEASGNLISRYASGFDPERLINKPVEEPPHGETELPKIEDTLTPKSRLVLRDPKQLKFAPDRQGDYDAGQLVNRLLNTVPAEKDMLEQAGIRDAFKPGDKTSLAEVDKWIEDNGPRVEVQTIGEQTKAGPKETEFYQLQHELDTRYPEWNSGNAEQMRQYRTPLVQSDPTFVKMISRYSKLEREVNAEMRDRPTPKWKMVGPKDEQSMPGYVEIAVTVPRRLADEVGAKVTKRSQMVGGKFYEPDQFPQSHNFPPNTLGFLRGYMETRPDGKKTFHVIEVQSDWMKKIRDLEGERDRGGLAVDEFQKEIDKLHHPLLKGYERMALKAAIDHARKEGADRIAVSDAETAMMTEGHDLAAQSVKRVTPEDALDSIPNKEYVESTYGSDWEKGTYAKVNYRGNDLILRLDNPNKNSGLHLQEIAHEIAKAGYGEKEGTYIPQEGGMRLHYDRTLPKILEELTGMKGERGEYGLHQNAQDLSFEGARRVRSPDSLTYDKKFASEGDAMRFAGDKGATRKLSDGTFGAVKDAEQLKNQELTNLRENLILKEPTGEPKTSVSAREYGLEKTGEGPYALTGSRLYSGLDPKVLVDFIMGHGVNRPWNEIVRAQSAKSSGYSAPRHAAVSEDLANKLVQYAAADIYAPIVTNSPTVRTNYRKYTLKNWIQQGVKDGKYVYDKTGTTPVMDGKPMVRLQDEVKGRIQGGGVLKDLFVRKDLAPEAVQTINGTGAPSKAGASMVINLLTEAQVIGPTDFVFHTANMFSSIAGSQGAKTWTGEVMRKVIPGAKQVDAIGRVGYHLYRTILNSPAVQNELAQIAKIGALRGVSEHPSIVSKLTKGVIDTDKWIKMIDRAGRLARNEMFDNLVKRVGIDDTQLNRREFINKMGQYNDKLMSNMQATLKGYLSQFVVAGRTFNRNAVHRIMMSNEVQTSNPSAYYKMKLMNLVGLTSTLFAIPIVWNLYNTGKPFGRNGTEFGKIDTGHDDDEGRHITIDPGQTDLTRRGMRLTGAQAAIRGYREDKPLGETLKSMAKDIVLGQLHPWEGPPARVLTAGVAKFGETKDMYESIKAALKAVNPTAESVFMPHEGEKGGLVGSAQQLGGSIGVGKSRMATHQEKVETIGKSSLDKMDIDTRVEAEQQVKATKKPSTREEEARGAELSIKANVQRATDLEKTLPKETRGWMESRELRVPGYDNKIHVGGQDIYLTRQETDQYGQFVKENYLEVINELRSDPSFEEMGKEQKKVLFNTQLNAAKARARAQMREKMESK